MWLGASLWPSGPCPTLEPTGASLASSLWAGHRTSGFGPGQAVTSSLLGLCGFSLTSTLQGGAQGTSGGSLNGDSSDPAKPLIPRCGLWIYTVPPLLCFLLGVPESPTQCSPTPCPPVLYLQFLDADNLLVNPDTLRLLMAENKTVVAPMLESRAAYANFWCGMTAQVS